MDLTVITVSMPQRVAMLGEAVASVAEQTLPPSAHLIRIAPPVGEPNPCQLALEVNSLLAHVVTEWVAVIEDDDLWYPNHLERVATACDADVVYTFGKNASQTDSNRWTPDELATRLFGGNFVPYNAAIKTHVLREVGGWGGEFDWERRVFTETGKWAPDWDLWVRVSRTGARFRCVPEVTWEYRQGPQSITRTWRH